MRDVTVIIYEQFSLVLDLEEVSALFAKCIPHLNYTFLDITSVLFESLDTIGIDEDLQNHQHCLLLLLYLAHLYDNR